MYVKKRDDNTIYHLNCQIHILEDEIMNYYHWSTEGPLDSVWKREMEVKRDRMVGLKAIRDYVNRENNEIIFP